MTRAPIAGSLREKVLTYFAENPDAILSRQDVMNRFDASVSKLNQTMFRLKCNGALKSYWGANRTVYYAAGNLSVVAAPKSKREWPASSYTAPRPIPVSVWDYAAMVSA